MGVFLIAAAIVVFVYLIYLVAKLCSKRIPLCKKAFKTLKYYLFYKGPLRYIIVGYLRLLSIFATLLVTGIGLTPEGLLVLYSILCLGFFVWPLWTLFFLFRNTERLDKKSFKTKYGKLFDGTRVRSNEALAYNAVFAVRRFDIILVNLVLNNGSPLSGITRTFYFEKIVLFLVIQTAYLGYIHLVRPHQEPLFNRLEFINEYSLCLLAYCMLFFTGGGTGAYNEFMIGRSIALLLILFLFIVNIGTMLMIMFGKVKRKVKSSPKCACLHKKHEVKESKKNRTSGNE